MGTAAIAIKDTIFDFFTSNNKVDYEAIVGIDFGSSGSGYAFSLKEKNDDKNGSNEVKYGEILPGQIPGAINSKVPTEIILDQLNPDKVLAFGSRM